MADATDFYGVDSDIFGQSAIDMGAIDQIRQNQARAQVLQVMRQNERAMRTLPPDVIDEVEEPSSGMLYNILDTIGTPGQWVQGGIAKLAGSPGYEDLSFLDAAAKGADEDRYTGDLLKDLGWLQGEGGADKTLRFLASFAGDVVTDPLSYLTTLPKVAIGGLGVANKALKLKGGGAATLVDLTEALRLKKIAEAKTALGATVPNLSDDMLRGIEEAAAVDSKQWAGVLKHITESQQRGQATGGLELLAKHGVDDPDSLQGLFKSKVIEPLGLDEALQPSDLLQKRGLRFSSIIPLDNGTFLSGIPLLTANTRSAKIPLLTDASEVAFDLIGKGLYNAKRMVVDGVDNVIDWGYAGEGVRKAVGQAAAGIKNITTTGRQLLSRKAQAGGEAALKIITQDEMARFFMRTNVEAEVARLKDGLDEGAVAAIGRALEAQPDLFEEKLARVLTEENLRVPESAQKLEKVIRAVKQEYDNMAQLEQHAGILENTRDSYIFHAYEPIDSLAGHDVEVLRDVVRQKHGSSMDPTAARKFATYNEAVLAGFKPKFDALQMYGERKYWHEVSMASARMRDRIAFEIGVPKSTMDKLRTILAEGSNEDAKIALRDLRARGVMVEPNKLLNKDAVIDAVEKSGLNVFRDVKGAPLSPNAYAQIRDAVADYEMFGAKLNPDRLATGQKMKELADQMGLTFAPDEAARVADGYAKISKNVEMRAGRAGERLIDRAGVAALPDRFKPTLKALEKISPADADYLRGTLPQPFLNAFADSLDGRSTLERFVEGLPKGDPMGKALLGLRDGYIGWLRKMKEATTHLFPAYFVRNFVGQPFQAMAALQSIGDALSPLWLFHTDQIARKGVGGIRQAGTGRWFTAKELRWLEGRYGVSAPVGAEIDLVRQHAEAAWTKMDKPMPKGWWDKVFSKPRALGQWVETSGRRSLFYKLIKNGADPESAAQQVNKFMVDYAHGKTRLERDFLNNMFFFYSFPKATLANAATAFMNSPGAFTTQLHTHAAAAELLKDPNAIPLPEDLEEQMATLRSKEMPYSKHIGYDPRGNPEFLNQVGLPVESLSSFVSLKTPKSIYFGDLMQAGVDSASRSIRLSLAQTNPMISKTIEMISGKALYFDRPITDRSLRKLSNLQDETALLAKYPYGNIPGYLLKGWDKGVMAIFDAKDNGDGSFTVDPYRLAVLSAIVPGAGRIVNTYNNLFKKGETDSKVASYLTGLKPVAVDLEKSVAYDTKARIEEAKARSGYPTNKLDRSLYKRLNPQGGGIDQVMADLFGEEEDEE